MSEKHALEQGHSNLSQMQNIKQNAKHQGGSGFTDLTNQFAVNITNVNKQRNSGPGNSGINFNQQPGGTGSYQSVRVGAQPSLAPLPNAPRGYSRGSKQSQKSQRNSGLNQLYQSQPSTANSKKRGATVDQQQNQQSAVNHKLNVMGSAVANAEGLPPHQQHLSPLQNPPLVSAQRTVPQSLHQKSGALLPLNTRPEPPMQYDYKVDDQEEHVQIQQKFSKQIQGVGGLKVLNEALLGQEQQNAMLSSYTNMKSELSVKESMLHDTETNSLNMAAGNKYAMKSRSNITLLQNQADHPIAPHAMASSKLGNVASNQVKMPAQANPNQANSQFMQKRISNSGANAGTEDSKTSRFAINFNGQEDQTGVTHTLPNIKLNCENYGQTLQKDQNQSSRKMSLAAKSGQMQVFNNLHSQNLNQIASRSEGQSLLASGNQSGMNSTGPYDVVNQQPNMVPMKAKISPGLVSGNNIDGKHQLPPHPSTSVSHKPSSSLNPNTVIGGPGMSTSAASGNANGSLPSQLPSSAHSKQSGANQAQRQVPMQTMMLNLNAASSGQTNEASEAGITHGSLALQSQSHSAQQSAQSTGKPGNAALIANGATAGSNCASTTGNYQTPLGSRQFESYLGRKQIIQQQREKKQELLKQLDMGQAGKPGAIAGAPNTGAHGEPRRTLTDAQDDQGREGFMDQGALRVEGSTMAQEASSAQGVPRRLNANSNALPHSNHGQSNSIAVHPNKLDGLEMQNKMQNNGQGAHYSSISPTRGSRQANQQLHPRGPNPLEPGGGPAQNAGNPANGQMTQVQGPYSLQNFDQMNNPHAKRRFKSNVHPVGAGPMTSGSVTNNQLQQHAYQNGAIPAVLGQQQQEFSQYLQQQLSPLNTVGQHGDGTRLQFQPSSAGQNDQIQTVGVTGNSIGLSSNIRNLNCMQNGQPNSAQHSKLENKYTKQRNESIKYEGQPEAKTVEIGGSASQQQQVHQTAINSRITRKLEGGRPHKVYDYMFIQMSMEQFIKEYAGRKILIMNNDAKKDSAAEQQTQQHYQQNGVKNLSSINNGYMNHHHQNQGSVSPRGGLIYQSQLDQQMTEKNKQKFLSPNKTPDKNGKMFGIGALQSPNSLGLSAEPLDLNGLVKIKAYESQVTDEIPQVQCNLQPTQLDHLKVLVCEQEDKFHPKLTPDAANRFEIEKQNQIKQYMEDIIAKLQQKERRFKVTVKKKFVEDALFNSTQIRVASVYVIVINRDKTYDPLLNQKFFKSRKRMSNNRNGSGPIESSSEEEDLQHLDPQSREEYLKQQRLIKEQLRRSANPNLVNAKKRSLYDSDANGNGLATDNMNSTSTSSNMPHFKKLMQDKSISTNLNGNGKIIKPKKGISTGPNFKRPFRKDDEFTAAYKYTPPVREYKYGPTKIRITQDPNEHSHHFKHPFNIFSNQYNEFIRLVLKNQKLTTQSSSANTGPVYKFNYIYAVGLAKALGMNLRKEAFSEQNMKSREHVNQLKERLIFCFWRKINEWNKDLYPNIGVANNMGQGDGSSALGIRDNNDADASADGETVDSSNCNNTPKSKNLKLNRESSQSVDQTNSIHSSLHPAHHPGQSTALVYPPPNIIYKYVIGKGNNSIMVRSLFKNRFWWVQHDKEEIEKCQYCWTQIRKVPIMEALPCKYPNRRSGLKNVTYSTNNVTNQSMQQILTTPQQKSSKKAKKAAQGSEKNSTNSKNMNDSAMQNTIQEKPQIGGGGNNGGMSSAYAETLKFTETKLYNKIEDNFHVNNKKALFLNMKNYYEAIGSDVFENIPLTFHVKTGLDDPEFQRFKHFYFKFEDDIKNKKAAAKLKRKEAQEQKQVAINNGKSEDAQSPHQAAASSPDKKKDADEPQYYQSPAPAKNIWIIKPGENTNRGHGIQVAREFDEIKSIVEDSTTNGRRTCIVQKYIHNPLLIHRRKFDIRTYVLCTSVNGNMKVYIYDEGYLRTCCREYVLGSFQNKLIHLTNDAVQKRSEDYGKFEPGNKLSYNEFQMYLDKTYPDLNICFERDLKPQMNKLTTDIFRACYNKLDPKRRLNCMEVFGLDFMFDDEFRPYVIEVNTNPCLELVSPLLARLIPNMLENALKISLDTQFLPPEGFSTKKSFIGDPCPENRFELVFDSNIDNSTLDKLFKEKANIIIEMDEDELSEEEEHDDEE